MISSLSDLECFKLSYVLAMDIFKVTRYFPKEERYSLTDQVIRASRSVAANIAEGWGKRGFDKEFKRHLIYALGSIEETKTWLQFAKDCNYVEQEKFKELFSRCELVGSKIFKLYEKWKTF
jgi:four helix bundle protein